MPPPNVSLWHEDYFKPVTFKKQKIQEVFFYLPLNCLKEFRQGPIPGRELSPEITMKTMSEVWWTRGSLARSVCSHSSLFASSCELSSSL